MARHISVAGKGGTGKTTFAALMIRWMREAGKTPILAVDADPNANLGEVLGIRPRGTIVDILAKVRQPEAVPRGMTKNLFIEYSLEAALAESCGVDLLVMGGPEGPGCYCFPNELLRHYMERLGSNYPYLVMDNEAGLEHLSRRVARDVDVMCIMSDPTARGIRSAGRIAALARSVQAQVRRTVLVVSMVRSGEQIEALRREIDEAGLELFGTVPADERVADFDVRGRPLVELPADSPAFAAVRQIGAKMEI